MHSHVAYDDGVQFLGTIPPALNASAANIDGRVAHMQRTLGLLQRRVTDNDEQIWWNLIDLQEDLQIRWDMQGHLRVRIGRVGRRVAVVEVVYSHLNRLHSDHASGAEASRQPGRGLQQSD